MTKIKKITNLKRLNFQYRLLVLSYLFKKILGIKPHAKEEAIYSYYNFLIYANGSFLEESPTYIVSDFKNDSNKKIKLRKKPSSDFDVFTQVFGWLAYEPVIESYNKNFKNGSDYKLNIIDAGCNIGLTSLYFIDKFKNPTIICIEPELENFTVLEYNLAQNNQSIIHKINGALWSSNTNLNLVNDLTENSDWAYRVEKSDGINEIQAFSINQIVKDYNFDCIDLLKMDVEGSEKQIFTDIETDLSFLKITKCIAIEIHDEFNCREDIYSVLNDFNFGFYNHGELTIGINQNLIKDIIQ